MSKRPSTADHDQSVTESGDGEPFLNRWARRKHVARTGGDADTAVGGSSMEEQAITEVARADVSADAPVAGEDSQAPELTDEDMPTLDSIDENTDMSGFFSPKVTQAVKKAALRKFFHSPAFNIVDGLDDYDEDFRNFAALGDIVTSDMRGMMEREAERAREAMAKDGQEDATPPPSDVRAAQADGAEEKEREDEPLEIADEDTTSEQMAALEAGVTREPGQKAGMAGGKLRPRVKDQ
jgi:hypothetical protein